MNWVQPKFTDFLLPPKKKQKLEDEGTTGPKRTEKKKEPFKENVLSGEERSWCDKFGPAKPEDLVVHKKKVEEVEEWLRESLRGNNGRILLVTGPSGSGKMSTVKVLCKSLGLGLTEWINPMSSDHDVYTSQFKAFAEFIVRATRYKSVLTSAASKRVVVVKDLPNIFLREPSLFHECIKQYSKVEDVNIVFVVSHVATIRELFPDDVKVEAGIRTIAFNPITAKNVSSALGDIVRKGRISGGEGYVEGVSVSCGGDLRNAIETLHFLTAKKSDLPPPSQRRRNVKSKSSDPPSSFASDDNLDLFRGLGRVLYAKRDDSGKLLHDQDRTAESFESCANHFISMLHENYLSIFSDLGSVARASERLAHSDVMLQDWEEGALSRRYALSTACRGLAFHNRDPVRRFKAFNRYVRQDALLDKYKNDLRTHFPAFDRVDLIVDCNTYMKRIPFTKDERQEDLLKEFGFKI